jgi:hypothetical protein
LKIKFYDIFLDFFNIHLNIIGLRLLYRFLIYFERHIKHILEMFLKKNNGLKGQMWLLIMWLDPMGKFLSLVGLQGLFVLNFCVLMVGVDLSFIIY